MKAFFVYDPRKRTECFVIAETDQLISADKQTMFQFISTQPDFSQWQGEPLEGRSPESLGLVVASRKDDGDVCIIEDVLWQERMVSLLGAP